MLCARVNPTMLKGLKGQGGPYRAGGVALLERSPEEEPGARRSRVGTQEAVGPVTEERGAEMPPGQGWARSLGLL